jgi:hypothetical protein
MGEAPCPCVARQGLYLGLSARRISARLAALPLHLSPLLGNGIILRHNRKWEHSGYSQTGASVTDIPTLIEGRTAHVFYLDPIRRPTLACPEPF